MNPLPKHIADRIEEEANERYGKNPWNGSSNALDVFQEREWHVRNDSFREGAAALWSILTEVSEEEEKIIEKLASESRCTESECYGFFDGAHLGLALSRVKESKEKYENRQ